ncbi:hypothetical protein D3C85_1040040 [compost metagenome]
MLHEQLGHQRGIADISMHEHVAWMIFQRGQVFDVSCIGQFVQSNHCLITLSQPIQDKIRANEAGATSNNNTHYL